jgi:GH35 family endo-1,4-beta-xylanase
VAAAFAAVALLASIVVPAASASKAPSRFFGIVPQGSLGAADYKRMCGVVDTIRIPVYWPRVEPQRGEYDFATTDEVVGQAAAVGIRVLPFVWGSPPWVSANPTHPPLRRAVDREAWGLLLRKLVRRYGPGGSFWQRRAAEQPIRRWQIWNEPNFRLFWAPRASPAGYARLLRIAARVIRDEDRGARIVLAGVAPIEHSPPPWIYLRQLFRVPGVKRDFDVVGLHPYAGSLESLAYQIEQARLAMATAGARRTPLEVTEFGVASTGESGSSMVKNTAGQAGFLRDAYELLLENRRRWRIAGADWFTWRDGMEPDPHCDFCEGAGLIDSDGIPKPAWSVYRHLARGALLPSSTMLKLSR